MGKEILITGANGFIGNRLVRALSKKNEYAVSTLDRSKIQLSDVKNLKNTIKGKDVVIHLGGLTRGSLSELMDANVNGTLNILKAISTIEEEKPLVIFSSSFALYKPSKKITEHSAIGPKGDYGRSKLEAEKVLQEYSRKFDIPVLALRLSNVYGYGIPPFSHSVIATFMHLINEGEKINLDGDGNQERDFIYIDDVVSAIEKSILSPKRKLFEIVNICSADPISVKELANLIGQVIGKKVDINYLPENRNDSWVGLNFNKAKKVLIWEPIMSLEKGISYTHEKKA